uniref:DUF4283 domain-containing protein n=1 Tax=Noccaea caerulescens TaxID=107243 RepID=A0A1J3IGF1_NOCCA
MQNRWFSHGRASALNPPPLTAGEGLLSPPLIPPDPPDPSTTLSSSQFPPLSSPVTQKPRSYPRTAPSKVPVDLSSGQVTPVTTDVVMTQSSTADVVMTESANASEQQASTSSNPPIGFVTTVPEGSALSKQVSTVEETAGNNVSLTATVSNEVEMFQGDSIISEPPSDTVHQTLISPENLTVLPPKLSSPLQTNKAASSSHSLPKISPYAAPPPATKSAHQNPPRQPKPSNASQPSSSPTLAERIRVFADKSLKRLAPITFSETGRPRVLIPDEVFQHGAELHKDFIVCYFNGRAPPRSMIVRIPSEYLRTKILEKGVWYVGDSMFHTAKWTSSHSASTSPLATIQLWAHLTGVPLDLRHQRGLSLVAGQRFATSG